MTDHRETLERAHIRNDRQARRRHVLAPFALRDLRLLGPDENALTTEDEEADEDDIEEEDEDEGDPVDRRSLARSRLFDILRWVKDQQQTVRPKKKKG